jgi:beta-aspartyl-peptidase (threonine type)
MSYGGQTLQEAAHTVVFETMRSHGIGAGMVVLGPTGDALAPYNTLGMYRGWITTDGQLTVATHKELHAMGPA